MNIFPHEPKADTQHYKHHAKGEQKRHLQI